MSIQNDAKLSFVRTRIDNRSAHAERQLEPPAIHRFSVQHWMTLNDADARQHFVMLKPHGNSNSEEQQPSRLWAKVRDGKPRKRVLKPRIATREVCNERA